MKYHSICTDVKYYEDLQLNPEERHLSKVRVMDHILFSNDHM